MRRYIFIISGTFILMIFVSFLIFKKNISENFSSFKVKRSNFHLMISLRGELKASRFVKIRSKIISNRAKIIELVPEGTKVKKGEIIARFDVKPFTDEYSSWEQKIRECKNRITKLEKDIEELRTQKERETKKVKYLLELENFKLKDITEGSGYLKLQELETNVKKRERKVEIIKNKLKDYKELFQQGYISKIELQKVIDELNDANEALNIAKKSLDNYKNYEWKMKIKQTKLNLVKSKEIFENQLKQIDININKTLQQLKIEKQTLEYYKNKLEASERDILNCEVKAPIDGVVLYNEIPVNGKRRKVDIGDSIWYGQTFLLIPDTSKMIVISKIKEYDLKFVHIGQKAIIIPDAFTNIKLIGKVSYISNIADKESNEEPIKYFKIKIEVENSNNNYILRSGMSATIKIPYKTYKNALLIPISSIIIKNNEKYVRLKKNNKYILKKIKIGETNENMAQVVDGLKEGDIIYY